MSAVSEARDAAVAETVARIRALEAQGGVTRETLAKIKDALIALGLRSDLFPEEDFPPPESGTGDRLYRLSMDSDDRFALYLNRGTGDKDTPPHDHTTWACVVGVRGQEHNKFYRRTDDRATPGRGTVEVVAEKTVEPGTGVAMTPDDIHSIHMRGPGVKMHLHMYGLAIHRLSGRVKYDVETGTYEHFEAHPDTVAMEGRAADPMLPADAETRA
ncbi:MAG: hypothetical protein NXI21_17805 [Alphaproteobacteria bacterium]|nr:hypothetical protein [Alphaproteobacteria bacterium]